MAKKVGGDWLTGSDDGDEAEVDAGLFGLLDREEDPRAGEVGLVLCELELGDVGREFGRGVVWDFGKRNRGWGQVDVF